MTGIAEVMQAVYLCIKQQSNALVFIEWRVMNEVRSVPCQELEELKDATPRKG